ncbi:MAG: hypothetical protein U0869_19210 [Chloroflexota bacterium]
MSGGSDHGNENRSMVSPRRSARSDSPGRGPAARPQDGPPPLSTARRIGVVIVVGALLASILLAFGGTSRPTAELPTPTPDASPTAGPAATPTFVADGAVPLVAPAIDPPEIPLITEREIGLLVTIPDPGVPLNTVLLRIYRGDTRVLDAIKVKTKHVTVRRVPLKNGDNTLTAVLYNDAGEGPRSEPITVSVDSKLPRIDLKAPEEGDTINGTLVTVRGVTEPGLDVTIANRTTGATQTIVSDDRGVFSAETNLGAGENQIDVSTKDVAGNLGRTSVKVTRGDALPQAKLTISEEHLRLSQLPQSVNIKLELDDPNGDPVDGAAVVFSISPPGLPTQTYTATTVDGTARWDGVAIPKDGAIKGYGFVTARAELGAGVPAASVTQTFDIR